jgi:FkbM family methyltransferase
MNAKTLLLNIKGGFRIVVPADLSAISTYVFLEQEDWFEDEAEFVRRLARPGFRMLDIGANVGFYSLAAAAASGGDARIAAFEPTPEVAAMLRASVAANGFAGVEVNQMALGDRAGELILAHGSDSALNRVVASGDGTSVEMRTLDDFAQAQSLGGVDFVKLDVEGAENAVIQGGQGFFARESPLVMFEVVDVSEIRMDAARMFEGAGYQLYELAVDPPLLMPFSGEVAPGRLNLFAAKPDRAAALARVGLLARAPVSPGQPLRREEILRFLCRPAALAGAGAKTAFRRSLWQAADDDPHLAALSALAFAARPATSPDQRVGALRAGLAAAESAVARAPTFARLMTAARLARSLGQRFTAAKFARQVAQGAIEGARMEIDEGFPVLLPLYETWTPSGGLGAWLGAMAIEAWWMWSAFSDRFRTEAVPFAHPATLLDACGRRAPAFERRRQLGEIMAGRQAGPVAAEILSRHGNGNLNADFWLSGDHGASP